MPYDLHVVRTQDFLRCNSEGAFDYAATKAGMTAIAQAALARGVQSVLLDVRDAQSSLKMVDMYELARTFEETGFTQTHRLAILHRYRAGERAEFFALCAQQRGWNVQAFESFEEAFAWLAHEDEEIA